MIDGQPLDLDLSWITAPLERKQQEGFRPSSPPKVVVEEKCKAFQSKQFWKTHNYVSE